MTLHINAFGGGAVVQGSADTRRIDELLVADSVDIGPRGALIATTDLSDYTVLNDGAAAPAAWSKIHALLASMPGYVQALVLAIGEGTARDFPGNPYGPAYLLLGVPRVNAPNPLGTPIVIEPHVVIGQPPPAPAGEGAIVTGLSWPGAWTIPAGGGVPTNVNVGFFNIGAREGSAPRSNTAFGLYVMVQDVGTTALTVFPMKSFNALGTGPLGDGTLHSGAMDTGSLSQQLFFRGVIAFNNFLLGWGFDAADLVNGDGPARVMFCNLGLPLKFGNDNLTTGTPPVPVTGNRLFTDSDAIGLGDAGEIIRAACRALGKVFFGTNRALHFIQGYGRDTFITNGSVPVMKAYNTVGPGALIEGPDRSLYGVGDQGLWRFDGYNTPEALFLKNWDFTGHSTGYWELLWVNPSAPAGSYPGRSNMDLLWMAIDYDRQQVVVGIPFCNASSGSGPGSDTVLIKFHVQTGGFTRQILPGVTLTCAAYLRQEGQQPAVKWTGQPLPGTTVRRYGYQDSPSASPMMPRSLPLLTFGPYAPFGPDGEGVVRRVYLTLSWESVSALPIVFRILSTADQAPNNNYLLTIAQAEPIAPSAGDCWLDTSHADPSIGNVRAAGTIPASGGSLLKTWDMGAWQVVEGTNATGTRATIPLPLARRPATRVTIAVNSVAASGRFQIEGMGLEPGSGVSAT